MTKTHTKMRIVIADDHPLYRKALRDLIAANPSLEVVGEVGNGNDVFHLIETKHPEILLLDLTLPGMSGIDVAHRLQLSHPDVKVIIITMHNEEDTFNKLLDAGVRGYVLKESAVDVILDSIDVVAAGDYYINPSLSHFLVKRRTQADALSRENPTLTSLTPMERKILKLVSENKMSKEIAAHLFISEKTVENHRMNISTKLNLRGSNSLLKFAIENRSAIAML